MKIIFAIPTWNRSNQLKQTIDMIQDFSQGLDFEIKIIISNNHSDDDTHNIAKAAQKSSESIILFNQENHISGMKNYNFVLEKAVSISNKDDYIWSFGDDDDLNKDTFKAALKALIANKPYFASVGNTKLPPHTYQIYPGTIKELVLKFGFFTTLGFISQCIYSHELAKEITQKRLMLDQFGQDAYSHSSSILYLAAKKNGIYFDAPVTTWRDYPNQSQKTKERWESEKVYDEIFNFVDTLKFFTSEGILPEKLDRIFFRYWRWNFWDFLIDNASRFSKKNPELLDSPYWEKIYNILDFLSDRELAKRISISIDLQRILMSKPGGADEALLAIRKYKEINTYNSHMGDY